MPDFQKELAAAVDAAREAAALIRMNAGAAGEVRDKGTNELVTDTDEAAQRLIIDRLARAFPDYEFLAEEGVGEVGPPPAGRPRWIIDPVDGTTNFTRGLPPYCVSIGLQDASGELVLGVVHEVALDEVFTAIAGGGLHLNGARVQASDTARLADSLVTTGFPFREFWYLEQYLGVLRQVMQGTRGLRRPGSAAADLAYVACGRFDAFFEAGLSPWDVAAGIVLVREAGGRVTGLAPGSDPLLSGQICATNGRVHDELLAIVAPLGEHHAGGPPQP